VIAWSAILPTPREFAVWDGLHGWYGLGEVPG
jgi:hypothetical protein